jgi:hypothetical protein
MTTQILLYAFLTGFSLILGVMLGTTFKFSQKTIAAIMAFGSGVLICALTFGLMEEAFKHGGFDAIIIGFLLGGLVFIFGDFLIHRYGGRNHKRKKHFISVKETNGKAIVLVMVDSKHMCCIECCFKFLVPAKAGFKYSRHNRVFCIRGNPGNASRQYDA